MMQAPKDRTGSHPQVLGKPVSVCLPRSRQVRRWLRDAWPQGQMRTALIIMPDPFLQQASQVVLGERDHTVQALSPLRAQEAFADRMRLRALWWGFQHAEPQVTHALVKRLRKDGGPGHGAETGSRGQLGSLHAAVAGSMGPWGAPSH
jgi:hypothetical protein